MHATTTFAGFSIHDVERAKAFYGGVLGLQVVEEGIGLRLHLPGGGTVFAYPKHNHQPATFTILDFVVENVDAAVDTLTSRGIHFERYPGMPQDEKGIMRGLASGQGPDIAWFTDPAGNILAVLQASPAPAPIVPEREPVAQSAKQGDVGLLQDPLAQRLLRAKSPAHLAYTWRDGTPRCIPIGFHWNGEEIVLVTAVDSPKTRALQDGARVALSIDVDARPPKILSIRGSVRVDTVEGIAPEYAAMVRRTMGEEDGQAMLEQAAPLYPRMTRIFIRPEWVGLLDFETRLPSAVERAIQRIQAGKE
jgi:catechol 2,3-dioxygenase-like lactoylglutathione lyase family enzyme